MKDAYDAAEEQDVIAKAGCQVIRSKKRQNMALTVTADGDLIIRIPERVTDAEALAFARKNRDWIRRKILEAKKTKAEQEESDRANGIEQLTQGQLRELGREAADYIPMRVAHYAALMGVDFGTVTIRNQRSRWGSCSAKGNLNFNVLLMLAPGEVLDSVIVHELCHLRHMNHSKAFYEEVLTYYPEYRKWDRWLKENGQALLRRMPEKKQRGSDKA